MSGVVKLAPVAVIQVGTVIDDGTAVTGEGPPVQVQVPLSKLAGCAFYDELMAKMPEFQAGYDASLQAPPPGDTPGPGPDGDATRS
jgi:hypothetical protein